MLDEIVVQQAIINILAPLMGEDLGKLIAPDGTVTDTPAFYIDSDEVPKSETPSIGSSFNGSNSGFVTSTQNIQENNPDYVVGGEEPEYLYYILRNWHTEFSLSYVADNGSMQQVLLGNRKSSGYLLRKLKMLFGRESVRKQLHEIGVGVDFIGVETPQYDLNSVRIEGTSVVTLNFTYSNEDKEQVFGLVDRVVSSGELKRVSEEDTNPINIDTDTGFV